MTTETQTPSSAGSRSRRILLLAVAAAIVLVIGVVIWWLSRDDAPEAASLEAATAEITEDDADEGADDGAAADDGDAATGDAADAGADGGSDDAAAGSTGGIEGQWTVDTSVGEFSFQDSTGTFVGFRVGEELQGVGEIEAVGRTPGVSGTIDIEGTTVTAVSIEADMAAITTDDSRRDNRVRGALETDEFPTATFVLTGPIEFGDGAADGDPVSASASGDLTVHGVTQPVTFDLEAQLVDDTVVVVGSTEITFADFGVTVPSAPIVLRANDFGTVELQLFLIRS